MIRLPPISTRTDTLLPYTTLFRSGQSDATLTALCEAPLTPHQASFDVRSSVANVCLGKFPDMNPSDENSFFSRANACIESDRSEEHTSELQSLMRISYAVFCLKKKNKTHTDT